MDWLSLAFWKLWAVALHKQSIGHVIQWGKRVFINLSEAELSTIKTGAKKPETSFLLHTFCVFVKILIEHCACTTHNASWQEIT